MKNKKLALFIVFILLVGVISGCSSKSTYQSTMDSEGRGGYDGAYPEEAPMMMDEMDMEMGLYGESSYTTKNKDFIEPDKIITTVYISMETKEFTETVDSLMGLLKENKGYIERSDISHNNYINSARLKYAEYTIRVPREKLEGFVQGVKGVGNIISENTSKLDITKSYRDTESRLRVIETKEERILALLEKAEKMEDIIVLENQLSDIIYEKENLTANLLTMDEKVDYATVNMDIREVAKLTTEETIETTFWTKLSNAISDSAYFFAINIQDFIIFLVYFIPYAIIIGLGIFILVKLNKLRKAKCPFRKKKVKEIEDMKKEDRD